MKCANIRTLCWCWMCLCNTYVCRVWLHSSTLDAIFVTTFSQIVSAEIKHEFWLRKLYSYESWMDVSFLSCAVRDTMQNFFMNLKHTLAPLFFEILHNFILFWICWRSFCRCHILLCQFLLKIPLMFPVFCLEKWSRKMIIYSAFWLFSVCFFVYIFVTNICTYSKMYATP